METKKYRLDYYTDMRECCGGNVGGTIYIGLTEEENTASSNRPSGKCVKSPNSYLLLSNEREL